MAIVAGEPAGEACLAALEDTETAISAVTFAEAFIVATGRRVPEAMAALLIRLAPRIVTVDEVRARAAIRHYYRWGKGFHKAKLNYCDCFAYALAVEMNCPLLYIGNDFALTDITSALA